MINKNRVKLSISYINTNKTNISIDQQNLTKKKILKLIKKQKLSNNSSTLNLSGRPSTLNLSRRPSILNLSGRPSTLNLSGRPGILNLSEIPNTLNLSGRLGILNLSRRLSTLNLSRRYKILNLSESSESLNLIKNQNSLNENLENEKIYKNINIKQNIFILRAQYLARKSTMTQQHAAIIVYHNKIIGEGINKSINLNNKYSIHAEVAAINDVKKKNIINLLKNSSLYVIRISTINNKCCLRNSKPCYNCKKYIEKYNIQKTYYSLDEINIEEYNIIYNKNKFNY